MKKIGLFTGLLFTAGYAFGQIPQGDFENWSETKQEVLSGWNYQGQHSKVTGPGGSDAVRIENSLEGDPSVVAYVDFSEDIENLKGGFPYKSKPTKIRLNMRYDIAAGDTAIVIVSFYSVLAASTTSLNMHQITGSQSTFIDTSFDITFFAPFPVDSCVLGISSGNFMGDGESGSWVEVSKVEFLDDNGATMTAIPNGDFSQWEDKIRLTLDGWSTTGDLLQAFGYDATSVSKAEGQWGSSAMLLETIDLDDEPIAGIAFTVKDKSVFEPGAPAFKADKKYLSFRGVYKYEPIKDDTAYLAAILYFEGNAVATARQELWETVTEYTDFEVDFTYALPLTPDSAEVIITSSDPDEPAGFGSKLWVDNLHFSEFLSSTEELNTVDFQLYPNPADGFIELSFNSNDMQNIRLIDAQGKQVLQRVNVKNQTRINTAQLAAGVYTVEVSSKFARAIKKVIIE